MNYRYPYYVPYPSYFPILVQYYDNKERAVLSRPEDIQKGRKFRVIKTNHKAPMAE